MLYTMSSFLPDFLPSLGIDKNVILNILENDAGQPVIDDDMIGFRKGGERLGMVRHPSLFGRNALRIRLPDTVSQFSNCWFGF